MKNIKQNSQRGQTSGYRGEEGWRLVKWVKGANCLVTWLLDLL